MASTVLSWRRLIISLSVSLHIPEGPADLLLLLLLQVMVVRCQPLGEPIAVVEC